MHDGELYRLCTIHAITRAIHSTHTVGVIALLNLELQSQLRAGLQSLRALFFVDEAIQDSILIAADGRCHLPSLAILVAKAVYAGAVQPLMGTRQSYIIPPMCFTLIGI